MITEILFLIVHHERPDTDRPEPRVCDLIFYQLFPKQLGEAVSVVGMRIALGFVHRIALWSVDFRRGKEDKKGVCPLAELQNIINTRQIGRNGEASRLLAG